jgi:oxygen-independent coproporphyrinogen-3 oxidase
MTSPRDIQHYMRPGLLQLQSLPPLSLYVHLPWCLRKCPYCDFNSHEMKAGELPEQRYIDALVADLEAALPLVWGRTVHSIFIGGGTPSLFSPDGIDRLLSDIRARLRVEADCEITLEANPGTFEKERFRAFRGAGVTRLSIGVQSFDDGHLKALGRVHDRAQALAAVQEAAQAFETFNLDIMYALPGQTLIRLAVLGMDAAHPRHQPRGADRDLIPQRDPARDHRAGDHGAGARQAEAAVQRHAEAGVGGALTGMALGPDQLGAQIFDAGAGQG